MNKPYFGDSLINNLSNSDSCCHFYLILLPSLAVEISQHVGKSTKHLHATLSLNARHVLVHGILITSEAFLTQDTCPVASLTSHLSPVSIPPCMWKTTITWEQRSDSQLHFESHRGLSAWASLDFLRLCISGPCSASRLSADLVYLRPSILMWDRRAGWTRNPELGRLLLAWLA